LKSKDPCSCLSVNRQIVCCLRTVHTVRCQEFAPPLIRRMNTAALKIRIYCHASRGEVQTLDPALYCTVAGEMQHNLSFGGVRRLHID
jgi:ApbE superfamily uncharacterized protein (UPF0280 family)